MPCCIAVGTNINDALLRGLDFLSRQEALDPISTRTSMIIFLTDGEPTAGITSTSRIMANVRAANQGRFTLFTLGFGHDVDFSFLQKISLQNRGLARKIYTGSDADLQLQGFYNEVSTPVLSDIKIRYLENCVDESTITDTDFSAFFKGSEIVIAGKLNPNVNNMPLKISGGSSRGYMSLDMDIKVSKAEREASRIAYSNFTERLWAYMTIKKLLDDMLEATEAEDRIRAKNRAMELSIRVIMKCLSLFFVEVYCIMHIHAIV